MVNKILSTGLVYLLIAGVWTSLYANSNSSWNLRGEVADTETVTVLLLDSNSNQLTTGSLMYYENGAWQAVPANGDGSFSVITSSSSVSLEMTYENRSVTKSSIPVSIDTVTFQTVDVTFELKNSVGELIDEGGVEFYSDGWRTVGTTSGGIVTKELLPGNYAFKMTYEDITENKTQDIEADNIVTFQTARAEVHLINSAGQLFDEGIVQYYAGSWKSMGPTSGGIATIELFPKEYAFKMTYESITHNKTQDISTDSIITFQTARAEVQLRNEEGALVGGGTAEVYSGGWKTVDSTGVGLFAKELLPKKYAFKMIYEGQANTIKQDIGIDPTIVFQTVPTATDPVLTINQPVDGTITQQDSITVSGTVDNPSSTTVTVNSQIVTIESDGSFTIAVALAEGTNTITISAENQSDQVTEVERTVTLDSTAPQLQLSVAIGDPSDSATEFVQVSDGDTLNIDSEQVYLTGEVYDALTDIAVAINTVAVPTQSVDSLEIFEELVELQEGVNSFDVLTSDEAGNVTTINFSITRPSQPGPTIVVNYPDNNLVTDSSSIHVSGTVSDTSSISSFTINGEPVSVMPGGGFTKQVGLFPGDNYIVIQALNEYEYETVKSLKVTRSYITTLPPDPITVAPPVDSTVITTMQASTEFLYKGAQKIQHGVEEGTIEARRASVVKGKVLDNGGNPLSGVLITVKDNPQFGYTLTRADGKFDMAVNGGGNLTLNYKKDPYLTVQRKVEVPWRDFAAVDSVVMLQLDPNVTNIDFSESVEVAQGSIMSDADGSRQATLMFEQGTTAKMILPDGSTQLLSLLSVRATEFTVGENGPAAMPGELPPSSGYTYAAEFSVDEAMAAGATSVEFDKPVAVFVENFIGFAVGTAVPAGYYDRRSGVWVPSENGRVIEITGIIDGMADIDIDGDGTADIADSLTTLGIDEAERQQLASLYSAGQSLWRTEVTHFTPWDFNWPDGPPADAELPMLKQKDANLVENDKSETKCGSVISVENQTLGEAIDITGTPCGLHYNSSATRGYKAEYRLPVNLTDSSIPASLKRVELKILIAGISFDTSFVPQPDLTYTYEWNGKDAYNRFVQGARTASVNIGYVYNGIYKEPADSPIAFGNPGLQTSVTDNRETNEITFWQNWSKELVHWFWPDFGGWQPGIHHLYDITSGTLYEGNGTIRPAQDASHIVKRVVGQQEIGYGDSFFSVFVEDVEAGPDGSLYVSVSEDSTSKILRKKPDGTTEIVIEIPYCQYAQGDEECGAITMIDVADDGSVYHAGDGIYRIDKFGNRERVTDAVFVGVEDIAVSKDGSIYVAEDYGEIIKKIDIDGNITTFAGTGEYGFIDDQPRPAVEAKFLFIEGIDIGPDGSVYIADQYQRRIRKVTPDGIISTIAGTGEVGFSINESTIPDDRGDGGPAELATLLKPYDVTVGKDGSVYISEFGGHHIRKINSEGIIYRLAGLVNENPDLSKYSPDNDGGFNFNNGPSTGTRLSNPDRIAIGPDDNVYFTEWTEADEVRVIESNFDQFDSDNTIIASKDGSLLYEFNLQGKHLRTQDALTDNTIFEFTYDSFGRLSTITDIDGLKTTVERTSDGTPTAFIAPFDQRTELTIGADGYLSSIQNPEGEIYQFSYTEGGLLTQVTNPRGNLSSYAYDLLGYFVRADYPNGGVTELAKTETEDGFVVTMTTAEGRTETYEVGKQVDDTRSYITTDAHGLQTATTHGSDGTVTVTAPDGTTTFTKQKPEPRFGMQAPITDTLKVTTPSGLTSVFSQKRTITQVTGEEITGLTDSLITNGKVTVNEYDANQRLTTTTSPEGRQAFSYTDSLGRVIQSSVPGIAQVNYSYDANGFLTETEQAGRTTSYIYNSQGWLESVTDPLGRVETNAYDSVGRVTTQTLPNGEEIGYSYDENGNLTSITPPGQPAHTFSYTDMDLTDSYAPPAVPDSAGGISYLYDKDKKLLQTVFSDSTSIQMVYDTTFSGSSRPMKINYDQGSTALSYDSTTGNLTTLLSSDSVVTSYSYDGSLTTQIATSGPVTGTIDFTYNNDFQVTTQRINGANTVGFSYDDDGLLVGAGELSMSYDLQNGLLGSTSVGNISGSYGYNSLGELTNASFNYNSSALFDRSYGLDSLGRITSVTETVGGETTTYEYGYNDIGYLVEVKEDGEISAQYEYDANGNRTADITPIDTVMAIYDSQDRLLTYGEANYIYGKRDDLQQKIVGSDTTRYDYDNMGNLRSVVLPDGTVIEYVIDSQDRRVAKKVNGHLVKRWLYTTGLMPVSELDSAGNVHIEYGPGYFVKKDTTYRVLRDQLGSVRMIVNSLTGEVEQQIDYDSFGNITYIQNEDEFIDIGYAGGLYDKDTGLTRFGARDYDPQTGRWTAKDPILFNGRQINLYVYVNNNPVNFTDPNGKVVPLLMAAGAGIGAVIGAGIYAATTDNLSLRGLAGAALGGAIAGGVGVVATPIAGALGLGTGLLGTAAINAGAGALAGLATAAIDPCQDATARYLTASATFGGLGGSLASGAFPTTGMSAFGQQGFPRTLKGLTPKFLGGNMGPNAINSLGKGGISSGFIGSAGPLTIQ